MQESNYWTRLLDRRLTRRSVLRAGAVGTAAVGSASLLAACGSSKNNKVTTTPGDASTVASGTTAAVAGTSAAGTPLAESTPTKLGGTYSVGFTGPFAGVDPHNSVYGGAGIVPVVYSLLVRANIFRTEEGIIPDLAASYEIMPDKVTYNFKLRPDAMIAQNSLNVPVRPIDADDVVKSFDRIADKSLGTNGFSFFNDHVAKYSAIDKTTVQLVTKTPYAWTLNILGNNLVGAIVPKELLVSPDIKKNAVGSGYMTLQELVEGSHANMVKNPNYFRKGHPYLDSVVIKAFADQATYRTAFSSGQVDAYGATNIDEAKELQKAGKNIDLIT
ncbi:MAG: ABC transporter substrate-binding protein, partial [Dehalococcoidia bacterium]